MQQNQTLMQIFFYRNGILLQVLVSQINRKFARSNNVTSQYGGAIYFLKEYTYLSYQLQLTLPLKILKVVIYSRMRHKKSSYKQMYELRL